MEDADNLKGYLLAAHPKRPDVSLRKGVILVIDQDYSGSVGLQLNKPMTSSPNLASVMQGLGISYSADTPIYFGGTENTNRIIVVHSADWCSNGTTKITDDVAISNDISVLAAISTNQGPSKFRAIAGYTRWFPGHLESEIDAVPPFHNITSSWSSIVATSDLIFSSEGTEQWHHILEQSAKRQIATWF
jgi:putative transcriptional regulator